MPDKDPIAEYPFPQAELWQRCLDLQPSLDRDAAELAQRGVTAARIQQFKADTEAFGQMAPDTVLVQDGATVTEKKSAVQLALEASMQSVLSIIAQKDNERTARYKRFGAPNVTALSEPKLHLAANLLVNQGLKYLDEYQEQGLTKDLLETVSQQNAAFVKSLAARKEAENTRTDATRKRILFANGLYQQLTQLCAAGNGYWQHTDASKAREYVVNPGAGTAAKATKPVPPTS